MVWSNVSKSKMSRNEVLKHPLIENSFGGEGEGETKFRVGSRLSRR